MESLIFTSILSFINTLILCMNLKLYTEFAKQRMQETRKQHQEGGDAQG